MAQPKNAGGLGFIDLYGFNMALLGKQDSILNAAKGSSSSFVWTGIWEAKDHLRKGFQWVVGDGEDIKIFKDPWLKGKRDLCVEDSHVNGVRNERVFCYFRPNRKDWDVQKVQQDFHDDNIRLILQTRIPQFMAKDRVAWMASCTWGYTFKMGYQYWSTQNTSEFASECRGKMGLWFDMQMVESLDIVEKIAIVLSSIWFARNQKIWENKIVTPAITVEVGVNKLNMGRMLWIEGESSFSIGMVLRDDHGYFIKGKNMRFSGEVTVMEAEARGVQEAITWIENLRLQGISIESDAQLMVKAVNSHLEYYLEVGYIIEYCKMKLMNRPDLSYVM
ncbi:uncharacterized protein LOC141685290 [Apium graveolens]|uniref:uncharacterized protein LOC141685290 n=1 Tax=Apium graveolens TaxID=4045 RepID=UPI003D7B1583